MNISYNWLKELIDHDLSPDELAHRLTFVGLTVEGVHSHGDDHILDIDVTSNRPDCLSHLGIAREIGAMTGAKLKIADEPLADDVPMPAVLAYDVVRIEDPDLCHRFTARIIRDVKIGPSPEWLAVRLEAIGERAINNVADITNYVMHELGQPMHSFDLDKLAENRIVVRRARAGETITTLDEVERKLDETILAICDAEKPAAVAGVMGGSDTGIGDGTTNVLLEVAYFDRASIRRTSRKLQLSTEASHRFERGVDIENLIRASDRATELICALAGGHAADLIDVYPAQFERRRVESEDISYAVKRLTSIEVDPAECDRILAALGIEKEPESIYVSPTWRHDIAIEEDLVEEVARHAGYDKIADVLPPAYGAGQYQPNEDREKVLRQRLVDMGFDEALTYSFIDEKFDDVIEPAPGLIDRQSVDEFVTLRDSVIEGAVRMRPSIMPGLLDAARLNFNHQRRDLKLFEVGKVFAAAANEDGLPAERKVLALLLTGAELLEGRAKPQRDLDFYDAKGSVEAALNSVGISECVFAARDVRHMRSGQSASISIGGRVVGHVGTIGPDVSNTYKFRQPVFAAEIDLDAVLSAPPRGPVYSPLPKFPGIVRDVSLLAGRGVAFDDIREAIAAQGIELCKKVEFVDVYSGKGMRDDQVSITIRMEYRSDERTLVDDEVDAVHKRSIELLTNDLGLSVKA